jgi:Tetratricopeptide repeat
MQQRPGITGKPVRLAEPPPLLAGREDLLAELDARLAGGDGSRPRTVALTGIGGTGKTSVALGYAHRHLAEVGAAWQFAAEDPTVLVAGFGELAAQLGARDVLDMRDPVASVHGVLAALPGGWLLLFDNAPDRASLERFLPPAGAGRVLITSRNALWPPGQAVEVPVLDVEVAAGFLAARTGDADHQAAAGLAEAVDGLPLALEQAAAYIEATGNSLAPYLASFQKRRAELLSRGQPTGYTRTVAATWALSFSQLEQSDQGAAGLLRLLAFCAPEAIPLRLLLQDRPGLADKFSRKVGGAIVPLLEDELVTRDAVAALRRYSLVRAAADGTILVHRLVQAVTAERMSDELRDAWRQAAAAVIEAAIPEEPRHPDTWPIFVALLPHARAALTADSSGMTRIVSYLGYSGSYVGARELSKEMLDARVRVLGPEHPDTLTARHNLARWTGEAGDAAKARDQYVSLLSIQGRVLGPDHPHTLSTRDNLAYYTGQAGDAAGARDQYAALLPITEQVLGPEHPSTLATRSHLAWWTGAAGNAAGARDQYAALPPICERVSGLEHPSTLGTRSHLAFWTREAGDPAGARDQFAALLPIRERVLGPEHPDTLATRADLAWSTGEAGDPAGARDQFAALLPITERVLGPEHPRTLVTRDNLARFTGEAGQAAQARDRYAVLLSLRERVLGPQHPAALATRHNLAYWTKKADGDAELGVK